MAAFYPVRGGHSELKTSFMIGQPRDARTGGDPRLAGRRPSGLLLLDPTGKPFGKRTLSYLIVRAQPWTPVPVGALRCADR